MTGAAPSQSARASRALALALTGLGATTVAALIWAQFRSYDMLDGAYYFLLFQNPADFSDTQTRFHLLARPIWLLCDQNIVAFRIVTLALASAASWLFWRAWKRLVPRYENAGICWWPLWLATMSGLTWVPVALTYNSIPTLFGLLGFAIILGSFESLAAWLPRRSIRWAIALVLAALIYGVYLAKIPAAAAFAICGYFLFCFESRLDARLRRALVVIGVLRAVVGLGATLFVVTRRGFGINEAFSVKGLLITPNFIYYTLLRYWTEIVRLLPALRLDFSWTAGPMILACGAALFGTSRTNRLRRWSAASLLLLLLAFAVALLERRLWDSSFQAAVSGEASRFYLLLWGSLLPVWIISFWPRTGTGYKATPRHIAWVIVLLMLPLISSFGSTNTVYVTALHETVYWVAGLLLVSDHIAGAFAAPWFRPAMAALISLGAAGHIFSGHFLRPYMYQPSLWKQTESVEIGFPATRLKIDPALATFLRDVRTALDANGYKPGDDVFGFFNLPGIIFSVGAKEPGAPWYFGTWYQQENIDQLKLDRVPLKRRQHAWIITQADVRPFRPQFLSCGIDFPDGYTKISQTTNPVTGLEVGIWKPRGRP